MSCIIRSVRGFRVDGSLSHFNRNLCRGYSSRVKDLIPKSEEFYLIKTDEDEEGKEDEVHKKNVHRRSKNKTKYLDVTIYDPLPTPLGIASFDPEHEFRMPERTKDILRSVVVWRSKKICVDCRKSIIPHEVEAFEDTCPIFWRHKTGMGKHRATCPLNTSGAIFRCLTMLFYRCAISFAEVVPFGDLRDNLKSDFLDYLSQKTEGSQKKQQEVKKYLSEK